MRPSRWYLAGLLTPIIASAYAGTIGGRTTTTTTVTSVTGSQSIDNSVAVLSNGQSSVSGLTNVLALAGGDPINDGQIHNPSNASPSSPYYHQNTLAGLAGISFNGQQLLFFLTDSGQITGPACTYRSTTNCFINGIGYGLTDKDAATLDTAWMSIEGALFTHGTYIPGVLPTAPNNSGYEIGAARALPLMIPIRPESDGNNLVLANSIIRGDGPRNTVLFAASSFGVLPDGNTVIPLMTGGNPYATPANQLGRWAGNEAQAVGDLRDIGFWGSNPLAQGWGSTYRTDGLALPARMSVYNVSSSWFYRNMTVTGDHVKLDNIDLQGGIFSLYWTAPDSNQNGTLRGDLNFVRLSAGGSAKAAMEVDGGSAVQGNFSLETYLNSRGYDFWGDSNGNQPIIGGAHFDNLMLEQQGLGAVYDDHVFTPATQAGQRGTYNDGAKVRDVSDLRVDWLFVQWNDPSQLPSLTESQGRFRRALFDANDLSGYLHNISTNGGNLYPPNPAGVDMPALFNVNGIGNFADHLGLDLEGAMQATFSNGEGIGPNSGTVAFFPHNFSNGNGNAPVKWENLGGTSGIFAMLDKKGNYTTSRDGDLMEYDYGPLGNVTPAGVHPQGPPMGVAQQNGIVDGQILPLATAGDVQVASHYVDAPWGYSVKDLGFGQMIVTPGSGGKDGTYTVTAQPTNCQNVTTLTFTVLNGSIQGPLSANPPTIPNNNNPVANRITCTGVPVWPLPSAAGLSSDAQISAQWPAAGVTGPTNGLANEPGDITVGIEIGGAQGSTAQGLRLANERLRLQ